MISGGRMGVAGRVLLAVGAVGAAFGLGYYIGSKKERSEKAGGDKGDVADRFANDAGVRMLNQVRQDRGGGNALDRHVGQLMSKMHRIHRFRPEKVGTLCVGKRCYPRSKVPADVIPLKRDMDMDNVIVLGGGRGSCHFETVYNYRFDQLAYFQKYAGNDGKLSWKEIQAHPFRFVSTDKTRRRARYIPSREEFVAAQNPRYDSDPKTLNFMEFSNFLEKTVDKVEGFYAFIEQKSDKLPHCSEEYFKKPQDQVRVRAAVRQGIVSALKDTWPAKKQQIWRLVNKGYLLQVSEKMYDYFPIVATSAHWGNPPLSDVCWSGCASSLYEIEEMASSTSLRDPTIKGFWNDVGQIYKAVLDKAKQQNIRLLRSFLTGGKVEFIELPRNPQYQHGYSQFTLWQLMEKTNPDVVKRIKEWK